MEEEKVPMVGIICRKKGEGKPEVCTLLAQFRKSINEKKTFTSLSYLRLI